MRIKMLVLGLIVVATAVLTLSYEDYTAHKSVVTQAQLTNVQLSDELKSLRSDNDQMVVKYNALFDECQKGVADYGLVTVKTKAVMPNCGLAIVQ